MPEMLIKVSYNGYVFDIQTQKKQKQLLQQLSHVNIKEQDISNQFLVLYNICANCSCRSQTAYIIQDMSANILDLCILFDYRHVSEQLLAKFPNVAGEHPDFTYKLLFIKQDSQFIKSFSAVFPYTTKQLFQCIKYFSQDEELIEEILQAYKDQYKRKVCIDAKRMQRLREMEYELDEQASDLPDSIEDVQNVLNEAQRLLQLEHDHINDQPDILQDDLQVTKEEYQVIRSTHPQLQIIPPPRDENYNTPLIAAAMAGATNLIPKFISYANCSNYEFKSACHYIDIKDISAFRLLDVETQERNNTNQSNNLSMLRVTDKKGINQKNDQYNKNLINKTENSNPYSNVIQELIAQGYFDEVINLQHNTNDQYYDEVLENLLTKINQYDQQFQTIIASFSNDQKNTSVQSQKNYPQDSSSSNYISAFSSKTDTDIHANGAQIDKQKFKNWVLTDIYAYQETSIYFSPLMYAVVKGDEQLVKMLVDDFLGSSCPITGVTALLIAVRCRRWEIAEKYLLPEKDIFTKLQVTPFIGSIAGGSYAFAKKHFWDQRDLQDINGMTPLQQAVTSNDKEAFDELIYQCKYEHKHQRYSLHQSVQWGYDYFTFKLLEEQIHCIDKGNCTALHHAVQQYEDSQNWINIIKMVLPFTAQRCDKNGYTALAHAIQRNRSQNLITLIASYEAGIKYKHQENIALWSAAVLGNIQAFKLLYPIEKRLYKSNYEFQIIAMQNNYPDMIDYLVNSQDQLYQIYSSNQNILQKLVHYNQIPDIYLDKTFHPNYIISAYLDTQKNGKYSLGQKLIKMLQKSLNPGGNYRLLFNRAEVYDG